MRYIIRDDDESKIRTHFNVWESPFEQERFITDLGIRNKVPYGGHDLFNRAVPDSKLAQWYGRTDLVDWHSVRRAAETRWDFGFDLMAEAIERLESRTFVAPRSLSRRPCRNAEGGDFELDRYLSGTADFFTGPRRRDMVGQQTVEIVVPVAGDYRAEYQTLVWPGVAAIAVATALERNGFSVAITMGCHVGGIAGKRWGDDSGYSQNFVCLVSLKGAQHPIDVEQMANATSPWWFRTILFTNIYCLRKVRPDAGLGRPMELTENHLKWVNPDDQRIYIQGVHSERTCASAVDEILGRFTHHTEFAE